MERSTWKSLWQTRLFSITYGAETPIFLFLLIQAEQKITTTAKAFGKSLFSAVSDSSTDFQADSIFQTQIFQAFTVQLMQTNIFVTWRRGCWEGYFFFRIEIILDWLLLCPDFTCKCSKPISMVPVWELTELAEQISSDIKLLWLFPKLNIAIFSPLYFQIIYYTYKVQEWLEIWIKHPMTHKYLVSDLKVRALLAWWETWSILTTPLQEARQQQRFFPAHFPQVLHTFGWVRQNGQRLLKIPHATAVQANTIQHTTASSLKKPAAVSASQN